MAKIIGSDIDFALALTDEGRTNVTSIENIEQSTNFRYLVFDVSDDKVKKQQVKSQKVVDQDSIFERELIIARHNWTSVNKIYLGFDLTGAKDLDISFLAACLNMFKGIPGLIQNLDDLKVSAKNALTCLRNTAASDEAFNLYQKRYMPLLNHMKKMDFFNQLLKDLHKYSLLSETTFKEKVATTDVWTLPSLHADLNSKDSTSFRVHKAKLQSSIKVNAELTSLIYQLFGFELLHSTANTLSVSCSLTFNADNKLKDIINTKAAQSLLTLPNYFFVLEESNYLAEFTVNQSEYHFIGGIVEDESLFSAIVKGSNSLIYHFLRKKPKLVGEERLKSFKFCVMLFKKRLKTTSGQINPPQNTGVSIASLSNYVKQLQIEKKIVKSHSGSSLFNINSSLFGDDYKLKNAPKRKRPKIPHCLFKANSHWNYFPFKKRKQNKLQPVVTQKPKRVPTAEVINHKFDVSQVVIKKTKKAQSNWQNNLQQKRKEKYRRNNKRDKDREWNEIIDSGKLKKVKEKNQIFGKDKNAFQKVATKRNRQKQKY